MFDFKKEERAGSILFYVCPLENGRSVVALVRKNKKGFYTTNISIRKATQAQVERQLYISHLLNFYEYH